MRVHLRPAKSDDAEFAFRVERETMEAYAIETWGACHSSEALDRAITNIAAGRTQVIELEGTPIGVLRVERTPTSLNLQQIFILPEFQRRGLGSELVNHLVREAQAHRLPLKLRVLKVNPAAHLYERLGFAVVETSPTHLYMAYESRGDR